MIREIQALHLINTHPFIKSVLATDSKSEWAIQSFVPQMIEKLLPTISLTQIEKALLGKHVPGNVKPNY